MGPAEAHRMFRGENDWILAIDDVPCYRRSFHDVMKLLRHRSPNALYKRIKLRHFHKQSPTKSATVPPPQAGRPMPDLQGSNQPPPSGTNRPPSVGAPPPPPIAIDASLREAFINFPTFIHFLASLGITTSRQYRDADSEYLSLQWTSRTNLDPQQSRNLIGTFKQVFESHNRENTSR